MNRTDARCRLDRSIVRHCSPTLAALKPGSLFTFNAADASAEQVRDALEGSGLRLKAAGVRIEVLGHRRVGPLLYVFRPCLVRTVLADSDIRAYLVRDGYDPASIESCLKRLRRRIAGIDVASTLAGRCAFPHEIGFFLGYPYSDVVAFIENGGEGELVCGCWKAYSAQRDAEACFCRYKECTSRYLPLHEAGASLEALAAGTQTGLLAG